MKRCTIFVLALLIAGLSVAACGDDDGSGVPSPSASGSPSPTRTGPPSETPVASPTIPPDVIEYTVGRGDTLFSIAQRHGTTVAAIVALNGLADPDDIEVGQVLLIPAGGVTATPAPTVTETPSQGGPAQAVTIGDMSRRVVALTFDAGADVGYTGLILDTLAAKGVHASFGMTGKWAEQNPEMLRRIVNEGHELINHSYDHSSFTGGTTNTPPLTREERWQQLDRTERIVQELAGATTKPYFRPPYGAYDQSVLEDVGLRGYRYNVMWTVDSRGWQGITAAEIRQRCLDLAEPGAIYIFHVGGQSQDGIALADVIDGLRAAGYEIGNVSDVLAP